MIKSANGNTVDPMSIASITQRNLQQCITIIGFVRFPIGLLGLIQYESDVKLCIDTKITQIRYSNT